MRIESLAIFAALAVACGDSSSSSDDDTRTFEADVRQRASVEFPCPPSEITVTDLSGDAFRASGCGAYATYECTPEYDLCVRAVHDDPSRVDGGD